MIEEGERGRGEEEERRRGGSGRETLELEIARVRGRKKSIFLEYASLLGAGVE